MGNVSKCGADSGNHRRCAVRSFTGAADRYQTGISGRHPAGNRDLLTLRRLVKSLTPPAATFHCAGWSCPSVSVLLGEFVASVTVGLYSLVERLFRCSRPSYVAGFIVSIDVDPINGVFERWPGADILKKVLERFVPALADRDPSASIAMVIVNPGVIASGAHHTPGSVLGGLRLAMRSIGRYQNFGVKATARSSMSRVEVAGSGGDNGTAVAKAFPYRAARHGDSLCSC